MPADRVWIVAEVPDEAHAPPLEASYPVNRVLRGDRAPGAELLEAVEDLDLPTLDYAWLCGEAKTVVDVRRHVMKLGLAKRQILYSGYWKLGRARG